MVEKLYGINVETVMLFQWKMYCFMNLIENNIGKNKRKQWLMRYGMVLNNMKHVVNILNVYIEQKVDQFPLFDTQDG